jgi:hypothetical protein
VANIVGADPKMTTALLDRLTHHYHIEETGNERYRFRNVNHDQQGCSMGRSTRRPGTSPVRRSMAQAKTKSTLLSVSPVNLDGLAY